MLPPAWAEEAVRDVPDWAQRQDSHVARLASQREPTRSGLRLNQFVCLFGFGCTFPCERFLSHTARHTSLIGATFEPFFTVESSTATGGFEKIYISFCTLKKRKMSQNERTDWRTLQKLLLQLTLEQDKQGCFLCHRHAGTTAKLPGAVPGPLCYLSFFIVLTLYQPSCISESAWLTVLM